jgi:hypothetical protein
MPQLQMMKSVTNAAANKRCTVIAINGFARIKVTKAFFSTGMLTGAIATGFPVRDDL